MKNKIILLLIPNLHGGGAERYIANFANYLINNNKCWIICTEYVKDSFTTNKGIKTLYIKKKFNSSLLQRVYAQYVIIKKLRIIKPGYIFYGSDPVIIFQLIVRIYYKKIRSFVIITNDLRKKYYNANVLWKFYLKINYKTADAIISVSKGVHNSLNYFNIIKSIISRNCVNTEQFHYIKKEKNNKKIKLVNVGSLTNQKNHDLLIKTLYSLNEIESIYELSIIGNGPLKNKIKTQIKDLSLEKSINMLGWLNQIELNKELNDSDIFVLSSNYEGMPLVILEALACGLPIVSTNCDSGPKEILNNGEYGLLVATNNADELKKGILKMSNNIKKYIDLSLTRSKYYSSEKVYNDLLIQLSD